MAVFSSPKVSIVKNLSVVLKDLPVDEILSLIKSGTFKKDIAPLVKLKSAGKEKEYKKAKEKLYAFTPSATFKKGTKAENFNTYSQIMVLDIDKLKKGDVEVLREKIKSIPCTYSCFVSPSGLGLKVLVRVDNDEKLHRDAFYKVKEYYEKKLNVKIDRSGVNVNRLCFLSSDTALYFNPDSQVFKTTGNTDITDVENILVQIEAAKLDITADYNEWIKICFSLIAAFGVNARDYFHRVSKFYPAYNTKECDEQFDKCLKYGPMKITFASFFWVAANHGINLITENK
jgi:hypothetical protein